ncbi:MAG TPA: hypothetical protein VGD73_24870 [Pseudonocardia sp.]|uniref:hypothetical protein n=1 Tax=Pseudonocardia sp. TaxID=60912 RepID=UPI002EDB60E6
MTDAGWRTLLEQAWEAVSGGMAVPAEITVTGPPSDELPSTLPVADAALACTGAALLAAAALGRHTSVELDARQVAAAVRSEGYLRVDGKHLGPGFAPLSRFWPAADGWVRTHGNYPWHRRALLTVLDISAGTDAARTDAAGPPLMTPARLMTTARPMTTAPRLWTLWRRRWRSCRPWRRSGGWWRPAGWRRRCGLRSSGWRTRTATWSPSSH